MFHVKFADIGEGIHEGVVFKVHVENEGTIEEGQTIMEIETDKVTAEIPSPVSGTIKTINGKMGDKVFVGDVIAVIEDGDVRNRSNMKLSDEELSSPQVESVTEEGSTSVVGEIEISSEIIASSQEVPFNTKPEIGRSKILATPVARKMAKDLGIDIQMLKGSGPAGRIMKADIKAAHHAENNNRKAQPASGNGAIAADRGRGSSNVSTQTTSDERIVRKPMTAIRKTIATKMTESKFTIPHTSVMDEVDMTNLVSYRENMKTVAAENDVKLTYLPFIIKAVSIALKKHEDINASYDDVAEEIIIKNFYNIGIAVDTPHGLIVPVIHNTDHKSILELASSIKSFSDRAKEKKLHSDELTHGTFTITNYGAFGSSYGVPIIRYPEAAILGIGAIRKKAVVINDEIVIRSMMPLSLSIDHRIIDGADACRFLQTLKALLENMDLLLLS